MAFSEIIANWDPSNITKNYTSADITINNGTSSYDLTETINELKDEIQVLKDDINNLRMLLLEN